MYIIELFLVILILAGLGFGSVAALFFVLSLVGLADVFGEREVLLKKIRTFWRKNF